MGVGLGGVAARAGPGGCRRRARRSRPPPPAPRPGAWRRAARTPRRRTPARRRARDRARGRVRVGHGRRHVRRRSVNGRFSGLGELVSLRHAVSPARPAAQDLLGAVTWSGRGAPLGRPAPARPCVPDPPPARFGIGRRRPPQVALDRVHDPAWVTTSTSPLAGGATAHQPVERADRARHQRRRARNRAGRRPDSRNPGHPASISARVRPSQAPPYRSRSRRRRPDVDAEDGRPMSSAVGGRAPGRTT